VWGVGEFCQLNSASWRMCWALRQQVSGPCCLQHAGRALATAALRQPRSSLSEGRPAAHAQCLEERLCVTPAALLASLRT
jgi:hypothetical protein